MRNITDIEYLIQIYLEMNSMLDNTKDLYAFPGASEKDIYLQDLKMQCADLEERVLYIAENLSTEQRQIVETYISMRDEMEHQSIKTALRCGSKLGKGLYRGE